MDIFKHTSESLFLLTNESVLILSRQELRQLEARKAKVVHKGVVQYRGLAALVRSQTCGVVVGIKSGRLN